MLLGDSKKLHGFQGLGHSGRASGDAGGPHLQGLCQSKGKAQKAKPKAESFASADHGGRLPGDTRGPDLPRVHRGLR